MPGQLTPVKLAAAVVAATALVAGASAVAGTPRATRQALACPLPGHRVMTQSRTAVVFLSPAHPKHGHSLFFEGCLRPRGRPIRLNARGDAPVPGPALAVTGHYAAVNTYSFDVNVYSFMIWDLASRRRVLSSTGNSATDAKVVLASDGSFASVSCNYAPRMGVFPTGPCRDQTPDQMLAMIQVGRRQPNGHYALAQLSPPSDNHAALTLHGHTVTWTYHGVVYHATI